MKRFKKQDSIENEMKIKKSRLSIMKAISHACKAYDKLNLNKSLIGIMLLVLVYIAQS